MIMLKLLKMSDYYVKFHGLCCYVGRLWKLMSFVEFHEEHDD